MKLKKLLFNINEVFYVGDNIGGAYREIFINPSWKEIKEASEKVGDFQWEGYIRFFAFFDDKDLFIFPADMLHPDAKKYIDREFSDNYLEGIGEVKGREVLIDEDRLESLNDELMGWAYETILEGKLDWLSDYRFNIEEIKRKYK